MTVTSFDTAQDNLAASLPGYERRDKQVNLAHKIESMIRGEGTSRHGLLQASTGTGKSLAYLIPAILSGKKVVVSTATKALQDQVCGIDLPFLQEHLGVSFSYAPLKGRSNYLCRAELAKVAEDDPALASKITTVLKNLSDIEELSFLGEETDFPTVSSVDFRKVTVSAGECVGKSECPFGDVCESEKAKAFAKSAQVVVVNHALLMTDLYIDGISQGKASLLGDYEVLVVDEAHELVDYATNVWGVTLREKGLLSLAADSTSFYGKVGSKDAREASRLESIYNEQIDAFWKVLEIGRLRYTDIIELGDHLIGINDSLIAMESLYRAQAGRIDNGDRSVEDVRRLKALHGRTMRRFQNTIEAVQGLIMADFDKNVRYVEEETRTFRGRSVTTKVIQALPIHMGEILAAELFADNRPCKMCGGGESSDGKVCRRCDGAKIKPNIVSALLSATLSIDNSFRYVADQLGLTKYESFDVGTPFDFQNQARLYIPAHLPEPTPANRASWESMSIVEIGDLVNASDGRALLLFTSLKQMQAAYDHLAPRLPYNCMIQGEGANKELAARFMDDVHSVLFATKSFFTGVDFSGSACSLVVMDKLPFAVPTDPVVEARCELIEKKGGNTFGDYTIPMMTLILQQGFGRLIRHSGDIGVVAILDRRLISKGYGKKIVNSLPAAPVITSIEDVRDFYERAGRSPGG
jgi:ATP-dependent DNA helicase DinG